MTASTEAVPRTRRFLEAIWCVNLSMIVVFCAIFSEHDEPLVRIARFINRLLDRNSVSSIGADLTVSMSVAVVAFCFFVGLRIAPFGDVLLARLVAATAVIGTPIAWFQFSNFRWFGAFPYFAWHGWYLFETCIAAGVLIMPSILRSRKAVALATLVTVVHFAYWAVRFWADLINPLYVALPVSGFCAALAATHYSSRRGAHSSPALA